MYWRANKKVTALHLRFAGNLATVAARRMLQMARH
jgi:hypothetical protein